MKNLDHETLVKELAALSDDERRAIVREAQTRARRPRATLPWTALRAALGIVHGKPADALADADALYDG